jgi:hypothetical protein
MIGYDFLVNTKNDLEQYDAQLMELKFKVIGMIKYLNKHTHENIRIYFLVLRNKQLNLRGKY